MTETEPISISDQTFAQAKQLEHALDKADTVGAALSAFPTVPMVSIWGSQPYNDPLNEVERHRVEINENLLRGLNRVAFTRYMDLVEGQEVDLAQDITRQHTPK